MICPRTARSFSGGSQSSPSPAPAPAHGQTTLIHSTNFSAYSPPASWKSIAYSGVQLGPKQRSCSQTPRSSSSDEGLIESHTNSPYRAHPQTSGVMNTARLADSWLHRISELEGGLQGVYLGRRERWACNPRGRSPSMISSPPRRHTKSSLHCVRLTPLQGAVQVHNWRWAQRRH